LLGVLGALVACALALAACGSSSKAAPTPSTLAPGQVGDQSNATTVPSPPLTLSACSLVTPVQVQALLGASTTGQETDYEPLYKTCVWTPASVGGGAMALGIIRIGNGRAGFGNSVSGYTSTPIKGLGDAANYSIGRTGSGLSQAILVGSKGTVSFSISIKLPGDAALSDSTKVGLTAIARASFDRVK
jgi:hypothetical protein